MKLPGQTQLTQLDRLPAALREQLRSLWIESAEEYVALLSAVDPSVASQGLGAKADALEDSRLQACQFIAPPKASALAQARKGGAMGCFIKPDMLEAFVHAGRLRPPRATLPTGFGSGKLPSIVRLTDQMRPVKDQGERGTCVAFSSVALREFLEKAELEFSEQFLYWACKELDGIPDAGTFIHTAMAALSEYGVCLASTWPYKTRQDDTNESQDPPSPEAAPEALQYRMASSRAVEPSLVEHYKEVLAGSDGTPGMPVVFAVLVFNSWFRSAETHRTGKITMPLPGERPLAGGHAMCVVGYVDDQGVPGGGYFIVRNSWGSEWAAESPEAPGHALVPYAYVEIAAVEAFTGPARVPDPTQSQEDTTFARFVHTLRKQVRDVEGKLLDTGTRVLRHPKAPEEVMEDTPANRTRFLQHDCAWTDSTRQRIWFPDVGSLSANLTQQIDAVLSARRKFLAALQQNLVSSVGMPFPLVHTPLVYQFIPYEWEPSVKMSTEVADLTEPFLAALRKRAGVPGELPWPEKWTRQVAELNCLLVYAVEGFLARSHVVVAFLTSFEFRREAEPEIVPLDQALTDAIEATYATWLNEKKVACPEFAFFTLGTKDTKEPVPENIEAIAAGDRWLMLSHLQGDGRWATRVPPPFAYRLALRDFLDQLKPETREERIVRIKSCVDKLFKEPGNITVDKVKKETNYRRTAVQKVFFTLQQQDPKTYRVWRMEDGQMAIRDAKRGGPVLTEGATSASRWIRRHAFRIGGATLGTAITAASMAARSWVQQDLHLPSSLGIIVGILVAYVGSILQGIINRQADKQKE